MIPIFMGAIAVVYAVRKNSDDIKNRCIKMALTAIFLSFPFVSQVMVALHNAPRISLFMIAGRCRHYFKASGAASSRRVSAGCLSTTRYQKTTERCNGKCG
jgi:hypothetical protein